VLKYAGPLPDDAYSIDMWSQTVYNAIKTGYRLLDGAGDYGNEKEAGEGVRRALSQGIVKREELCV
jgi:D-xylose reductase